MATQQYSPLITKILGDIGNGTATVTEYDDYRSWLLKSVAQGFATYNNQTETYTFHNGDETIVYSKDFYTEFALNRQGWSEAQQTIEARKKKYDTTAMTADRCRQILMSDTSNRSAIDSALSYYAMHYNDMNKVDDQRVLKGEEENTLKYKVFNDDYMRLKMSSIAEQVISTTDNGGYGADAGTASAIRTHYLSVLKDFGTSDKQTLEGSDVEQKQAEIAEEALKELLGNETLTLSDQEDFKLPDMGDYYLGNVDTTYFDEISKVYEKKKNAQAAVSYAGGSPEVALGYYPEKDIYFLKAKVKISDEDIENGFFGPDFLTLSLADISSAVDDNNALEHLTQDIKDKTSEHPLLAGNTAGNLFELKLVGMSALQPPRWAVESNVPKAIVKYKGLSSLSINDYSSDNYVVSYKDLASFIQNKKQPDFAFVYVQNKWHQAELIKEEKDTLSFRWLIDAGVEGFYDTEVKVSQNNEKINLEDYDNGAKNSGIYGSTFYNINTKQSKNGSKVSVNIKMPALDNYDDNVYTKEILREIIENANGEIYVRFEGCGITPGSLTFPCSMAPSFTNVNTTSMLQKMAADNDDMSLSGYNRIHVQTYRRYLGEAYVKMDPSYGDVYVNIAKLMLAKSQDRIKEMQEIDEQYDITKDLQAITFSTDYEGEHRGAFQLQEYNLDSKVYADAFFETVDALDDRKDIQKKLFHNDWDSMLDWNVTLGDVTFFVPPVNIRMETYTHSERMSLLRARGSAAKTDQRMNRILAMDVFFNEEKAINGYPYITNLDDTDKTPVIYYINGLRAVVSMFKFTPFLPISNNFINQVLGIDAVVFTSLQISSVPNYPKLIHATITMTEFDWRVYMPDIVQLETATTLGTVALQQEVLEKARDISGNIENVDTEQVEEVVQDLVKNSKYRNWFEKTINWKTFRYYYQRPIRRGNLLKDLRYDFNSEEYIYATCGGLTSLVPMEFKDPTIKFYMANEAYLQEILKQRYELLRTQSNGTSKVSFTKEQLNFLEAVDALYRDLTTLSQNTEFQSVVDDADAYMHRYKTTFRDFEDVRDNTFIPDDYYNQGCITNGLGLSREGIQKVNECLARIDKMTETTRTKYKHFFETKPEYMSIIAKNGQTVSFAVAIHLNTEGLTDVDFATLKSNLQAYLGTDPFREQGNWEGPYDTMSGVSEDRIIIPMSIAVNKIPGNFADNYVIKDGAKFQLNGNTASMQLLPLAKRLIEVYKDSDTDADVVPDVNSLMNLVYDEYKLADQSSVGFLVTHWEARLTNHVSNLRTLASDGYAPQYLGGEDVTIDVEIQTQNKQAATLLTAIPKQISRLTRKYHLVMPCIPLRIESEFSKMLGVNEVTCEQAYISTVSSHPGLYTVNMSFISMDRTIREREAANRKAIRNAGYNYFTDDSMTDYGKGQLIGAGIGAIAGLIGGIKAGVAAGTVTAAGIGMTLGAMATGAAIVATGATLLVGLTHLFSDYTKLAKSEASAGGKTEQSRKYRHYIEMQNALAEIDLYPDLELPTIVEMELVGFYFTRYKFQDNRVYVDPDFYFIYPVKLTSHVYRELAIHGMESGIGDTTLTDVEGACIKIQPSVNKGFTIISENEKYQEQRTMIKEIRHTVTQMMQHKKLDTEKNIKETTKIEMPFVSLLNLTMERDAWSVCEQIQCMFLERKFLKEVKNYERTQMADTARNATTEAKPKVTKEISSTEGRYVFNKLETAVNAAQEFYSWLTTTTIESTISSMSVSATSFFEVKNSVSGDEAIIAIKTAVSAFCEIREVRTFFEALNIDINDSFKNLTANIICAAACSATGRKEYSGSASSSDWKPDKMFVGVQLGTSQNGSGMNEVQWSKDDKEKDRISYNVVVKRGIEFGPFRFKMYTLTELITMLYKGESADIVKPDEDSVEQNNINYERFLFDPCYRTASVALIEQYKGKCITSMAYATYAYMRLLTYWLCRLVYLRVFPNISTDIFRKNAQHEIDVQGTTKKLLGDANAEVMVKGGGDRLVSLRKHIDFFSKNMYIIDAGKIWTAAVLLSSGNDQSILRAIEKRNYDALNAILETCSAPSSNFAAFNNSGALTIRKMTLALVGLGVINSLGAVGSSQVTPAVASNRDTMQRLYIAAAENPKQYIPHSFHDMIVTDARGRMLRAFPTFYMCLIDEGREIGFWKMHDNFYNTSSISSIEVVKSRKLPTDVCTIVMSNFYNSYATELEDYIKTPVASWEDAWNSIFSPSEYFQEEEIRRLTKPQEVKLRLRQGARIHVRMGYGNNAAMLPPMFNGCIAEVSSETTITIVAQGDGVELLNPINIDKEAHNLPNQTDVVPFSLMTNAISPLQLSTCLFTQYGGLLEEQARKRAHVNLFPRNPFGIVHFGDPDFTTFCKTGETCQNLFEMTATPKYGGNIDSLFGWSYMLSDDVVRITFDLFQKTPWDVLNICKSIAPDARLAVLPFGFRSTVFMGHPQFYYCYDYYRDQDNVMKEKRKPFQQWHIYTSELDIVGNGIVATNRDVKTVAVGLFQTCEGFMVKYQNRVGPLYADWDIYSDVQRTMIVDTSLLGKGVPLIGPIVNIPSTAGISTDSGGIDALFDDTGIVASHKKIAWRATASALRESVMDMYAGDLVVFGDPSVKPQDRIYVADKYTGHNGQMLVKEVVHSITVEKGFTTTISPDCIATVGDNTEIIKYEIMNRIGGLGAAHSCLASNLADSMSWVPSVGNIAAWAAIGVGGTAFIGVPLGKAVQSGLQKVASAASVKSLGSGLLRGVGAALTRIGAQAAAGTVASSAAALTATVSIPLLGEAALLTYLAAITASILMMPLLNVWIENELKNHKVITIYPIKKYGYAYTAGFEGARGTVYGSPSWGDRGSLGEVFDFLEDFPLMGYVGELLFSDNVKNLARKYQRDNAIIGSDGEPVVAENEKNRLLQHIAGADNNYLGNSYLMNQLKPRATTKTPLAFTNSYNHFKKLDSKNWKVNLSNVLLISQDARIYPYIKEKSFLIVHEVPGLPVDGRSVTDEIVTINGTQYRIKAIHTVDGKGNAVIDVPFLHEEAVRILAALLKRTKDYMVSANPTDTQEHWEITKNDYIVLKSALRIGDRTSLGSTGFTFVLQATAGNSQQALNAAIADLQEEIQSRKNVKGIETEIFSVKQQDNGELSIVVTMPQIDMQDVTEASASKDENDSSETEVQQDVSTTADQ